MQDRYAFPPASRIFQSQVRLRFLAAWVCLIGGLMGSCASSSHLVSSPESSSILSVSKTVEQPDASSQGKLSIEEDPRYIAFFNAMNPEDIPPMPKPIDRASLPKEVAKEAIIPTKYPYVYIYKGRVYFKEKFYIDYDTGYPSEGSRLMAKGIGELIAMDPKIAIYFQPSPGPLIVRPKGLEEYVEKDSNLDKASYRTFMLALVASRGFNEFRDDVTPRITWHPFHFGGMREEMKEDFLPRTQKMDIYVVPRHKNGHSIYTPDAFPFPGPSIFKDLAEDFEHALKTPAELQAEIDAEKQE